MRKTILLLLSLAPVVGFCQATVRKPALTGEQVHSLAVLAEVWGFLKYYHPAVAQGQQDWDSVLIQKIPLYLEASGKDAVSRLTAGWLTETGTPAACGGCDNKVPDSCKFNLDLSWISETNFSREVADRLLFIRDNRNQDRSRFVQMNRYIQLAINERVYNTPEFMYPAAGY